MNGSETVFDVFLETPYTFLKVSRGTVHGKVITSLATTTGVFKHRDGLSVSNNQETRESDATLHVHPTESFISTVAGNMVGHGIRKDGQDYSIIGQTIGDNFHTNVREHYRLTLQRTDFSDFVEAS